MPDPASLDRIATLEPSTDPDARGAQWLVETFARRTSGVRYAAIVKTDGLLLTASRRFPPGGEGERLAAAATAMTALARTVSAALGGEDLVQTVVETDCAYALLMGVSPDAFVLAAVEHDSDLDIVGHQLTALVVRLLELPPNPPSHRGVVRRLR